ncbi:MAG: DUF86 domain-containing protein [Nitrospirae bacterium]|nr:DUF86 domain-containing protein [Nitrospirota bacterium]
MIRKISLYLRDILQNMRDVEEFIQGLSQEQFETDKKTLNAVLRSIEVIGEAAKNVPDDIRLCYPAVPWKEMDGMRDKLIHDYLGVDTGTVWLVAKDRVPVIRPVIEQALQEVEQQEDESSSS